MWWIYHMYNITSLTLTRIQTQTQTCIQKQRENVYLSVVLRVSERKQETFLPIGKPKPKAQSKNATQNWPQTQSQTHTKPQAQSLAKPNPNHKPKPRRTHKRSWRWGWRGYLDIVEARGEGGERDRVEIVVRWRLKIRPRQITKYDNKDMIRHVTETKPKPKAKPEPKH
jgi:hypothetical protein